MRGWILKIKREYTTAYEWVRKGVVRAMYR